MANDALAALSATAVPMWKSKKEKKKDRSNRRINVNT